VEAGIAAMGGAMMKPLSRRALLAVTAMPAVLPAAPAHAADPIASATVTPLGGTVTGRPRPGPWRIAFSIGYRTDPWREMCVAAIEQEVARRRAEIAQFVVADARGSVSRQIDDLTRFTTQRYDAILCIPNSPNLLTAALAGATAQGIVTVPFNLPVDGEKWSTYVGTDPTAKGRALGAWLVGALQGRGRIVGLGGVPNNPYSTAAWAGAQAAFKGGDITVSYFAWAWWRRDRARAVMAGLLGSLPEIDGIWCDGGQDAAGAVDALLAARRKLVPVTGDDNNGLLKLYAALAARAPEFSFGLISEPTWQGVIALRAALTLLGGGSVPKRQIVLPAMITPANYQQYIRPRLPDSVFVDTALPDATLARIFG
jgi:ribose transport system substrate-binding protein